MIRLPRRAWLLPAAALAVVVALGNPASAQHPEIEKRRAAEKKIFTDKQIFDGFFKIAFGAELQIGGRVDRIRKYDVPIRVLVENNTKPDRSAAVAAVIADIKRRVANLDIAITSDASVANVVIHLVRERELPRTLRSIYGTQRSRAIMRQLKPQCLSGFRKDESFRITRSDVFLVTDVNDFIFYDCAYEEILQSLGPINDTRSIRWTMFNDDVRLGFFGVYDQYLLNILYHPRVRPGATRSEVRALLPQIMPEIRAWVAQMNGLPP